MDVLIGFLITLGVLASKEVPGVLDHFRSEPLPAQVQFEPCVPITVRDLDIQEP